jgi:L-glyceraldehyde 3-phosphate reductase
MWGGERRANYEENAGVLLQIARPSRQFSGQQPSCGWRDIEAGLGEAGPGSMTPATSQANRPTNFLPIRRSSADDGRMESYTANPRRYESIKYVRCGRSGLKLPRVSLGLWHNFGGVDQLENQRALLRRAFDLGLTHFDLANNYGPPPGSAEENFGRILKMDFATHRDELIISTKAGYGMWDGPYGDWGSRKYVLASLDQSLKRMGLPYVDIFYHHRPDPETPLEETMGALADAVRSGRALYAGLSNYKADQTRQAAAILRSLGVPLLIHQPVYNMFNRWVEPDLLPALAELGVGCIPFSPLAQGLLTNRYLQGIPDDSRAHKPSGFLKAAAITPEVLAKVRALNEIAVKRGSTLAQFATLWLLRRPEITTVLIGASKVAQIDDIHGAIAQAPLSPDEIAHVETILKG